MHDFILFFCKKQKTKPLDIFWLNIWDKVSTHLNEIKNKDLADFGHLKQHSCIIYFTLLCLRCISYFRNMNLNIIFIGDLLSCFV